MKQLTFFKSFFLLCALMVGSSVWAKDTWEKVTDYSTLSTSDTYVIAGNVKGGTTWYSLKNNQKTSNTNLPHGSTLTIANNKITSTISADETWVLESTGTAGIYYIKSTKGTLYLQNTGATGSKITSKSSTDTDNQWKIHYTDSKTSSGNTYSATALYNVGRSRMLAAYNTSDWRCYQNSNYSNIDGAEVVLFKKVVIPDVEITAESNNTSLGTVSLDGVTITASPTSGNRVSKTTSYTISPNNAATISQNGNVFTVSPTADCTITINFEAIPSHTLSYVVSPSDAAGIVTLGATSVLEDASTTIVAEAKAGYEFTSWSISGEGASLESTTDASTTMTMGSENAMVTATFTAVTTHAISWSVNGNIIKTENIKEGNNITFAAPASGIPTGYVFQGWSASQVDGTQSDMTGISLVDAATSDDDITYYAVLGVGVGTPASLTKLTKDDDIADGDKIVFVAVVDEETAYGMYQQTQSSSYVAKFDFTESLNDIAADNKKWFTLKKDDSNWKIGDDTNGYLYSSSSTNLAVSTDNSTKFVLEKGNDGTFQFSYTNGDTKRYLCCRNDLTSDKANLFRLSSSDGVNKLTLYRYTEEGITYTNFCTTVPTATVTIAAACNDGKGVYYGTYSNGSAFVVPAADDMTVSAVSVDGDGKLVVTPFDEGDIVKAGTGVMVSSTTSGAHTITLAAGGADIDGNMLKGSGDAAISASDMSTAAPSCKYYRLTMHGYVENVNPGVIGFYWGAADGASFAIAANKAYLAVPAAQAAKMSGFAFDDTTTGINGVEEIAPVTKTRKVVKNGRLVIETANGEFTIDGARMK